MDPMEAIRATFFQECDELLADLEAGLLALEEGAAEADTINAVFRAVHSVKGGAGAFGLDVLVRFAHVFETTLDGLRNGKLAPDPDVLKVLLRAADMLSDHVSAARSGGDVDAAASAVLIHELEVLSGAEGEAEAEEEPDFGFAPMTLSLDLPPPPTGWTVRLQPKGSMYRSANDALLLVRELERLAPAQVELDASALPALEDMDPAEAYLAWTVTLTGEVPRDQVEAVFDFVEGDCDVQITGEGEPAAAASDAEAGEADLDIAAILARVAGDPVTVEVAPEPEHAAEPVAAPVAVAHAPDAPAAAATSSHGEPLVQTTIRVDLERVDRLIDLVGELVINQAMLAQRVMEAGLARSSTISLGLDDLEQLTREIQDSVMAIRAQPVKSVFQRMPRLVREVAAMTGKKVRLITDGEGTEVDKTVIERLSDPLTHMIRNAIDHGLETPDKRLAAGKPEEGVVRLSAQHRSGRIVIEVADDGRGIDRQRVRQIAVERGVVEPDAQLSDEEIDNLIFAPGFSTASQVSDISGRGVGMDVVKRSIQALGGRIVITSRPGEGSVFTLSLPLTLAVLDGMVVTVGDQTLVVPINVIVETLQPKPEDIRALGPSGSVVSVRGSHVPLIDVGAVLGAHPTEESERRLVTLLVESELGGLAALRVDSIQGQRQVVIKSLEQNYRQVDGVAAATILGDGRVALILDVDAVLSRRLSAPAPVPVFAKAS